MSCTHAIDALVSHRVFTPLLEPQYMPRCVNRDVVLFWGPGVFQGGESFAADLQACRIARAGPLQGFLAVCGSSDALKGARCFCFAGLGPEASVLQQARHMPVGCVIGLE